MMIYSTRSLGDIFLEKQYTVNDILYAIVQLDCKYGRVFAQDIAQHLGVKCKNVKFQLEYLLEKNYIEFDIENRIILTKEGEQAAFDVYECRRFFERMFLQAGVREDIARTDAASIESVISHHTYEKLAKAQIKL